MSISIGGINGFTPAYVPPTDAYISEAAANMHADIKRTDSMLDAIRSAQTGECPVALMEACEAFESYFLQMMFKEMRRTTFEVKDGMFAKSTAEKIFTEMLDEQVAILASQNGGIGLAGFMFQQMQREGMGVISLRENFNEDMV